MQQRRHYKNPPIEEALCEFHFKPKQDWDLTIPGKLQAAIGDEYIGKPQEQRVVQVGLQAKGGKPSNLSLETGLAKVQLVTSNGKRMVGVGPDVLSIHMLRPYHDPQRPGNSGWEEFLPRIEMALTSYWDVAQPQAVIRVGIRYINKIVIPQRSVEVKDFLNCALPQVEGLPDELTSFMSRVDYTYGDNVRIVLAQGSTDAPQNYVGFLLDLDVIWEGPEPLDKTHALTIVSDLRGRERAAFEAVITEKARELFDAD